MPFKPVQWQELEVIKSSKLNDMVNNDEFLLRRKVSGAVRNIDRDGNPRAVPRYLKEGLVMCAGYNEFTPGASFPEDSKDGKRKVTPVFEREFKFPKGTFDPEFKPIVICTVGTKNGIRKITWTIKTVSSSRFVITIRELAASENFERDMEYFINWIAMGVGLLP
jgi:hypothetical protein